MRSFTLALTAVLLGSAAPSLAAPFGFEAASDVSPVAHSLGSRGITAIENMPAYLAKREPMPVEGVAEAVEGVAEAAEGGAGDILPSGPTPALRATLRASVNPGTGLRRGAFGNALRVAFGGSGLTRTDEAIAAAGARDEVPR